MQLIFLSHGQTILLDVVIWVALHLGIGFLASRIPIQRFNPESAIFRTRPWEQDGEIYQKFFHVRAWKKYLFSGAAFYRDAYEIKHLKSFDLENLKLWRRESCRAEFCHLTMIPPGFLFFFWNPPDLGWMMVVYAFLNNFVSIITQRYNRPRISKLIKAKERLLLAASSAATLPRPPAPAASCR